MKSALVATFATVALKAQSKAAQHLESCERCRRLFISAYDESAEDEASLFHSLGEGGVFGLTAKIIRELRTCPEWPAGT
jgi:hypothetical protein